MSVSLARRFAFLLVLSSIPLVTTTCTYIRGGGSRSSYCKYGNGSKIYPMICVDEQALTAEPQTATVYDFVPGPDHKPSTQPVVIRWQTKRNNGVELRFGENNTCVERPECKGGQCSAKAKPFIKGQNKCSYEILSPGKADDMGFIVINPCCG